MTSIFDNENWLKLKGFNFEKLLIDNFHFYADKAAEIYVANKKNSPIDPIVKKAFADGFRECTRQMHNNFKDCHPQAEINFYVDELIKRLEKFKK